MSDSETDNYYSQTVPRHSFRAYQILAGVMLYIYAGCSYRQVVKVMEVMRDIFSRALPWIFSEIPTHACVEDWIEKAGLASMHDKAKSIGDAYAVIMDESVTIGGEKLLVGLAFKPSGHGRPLRSEDMTVVEMSVSKSRTGEDISEAIEKIGGSVGHKPVYGVSDNGTNLDKGLKLAGIPRHRDISHTFGSYLKSVYDGESDFKEMVEMIGRARRWTLTEMACLMPPNMRSMARYMNLYDWVEWSERILEAYHRLSDDERYFLGFVPRHASLVDELSAVMACMRDIMSTAKSEGLSHKTACKCKSLTNKLIMLNGNDRMRRLGTMIKGYFDKECELLESDNDCHVISSDIIESTFGHFKQRSSPDKQAGITCSALVIPLKTMQETIKERQTHLICDMFNSTTIVSVMKWKEETLSKSNLSKRYEKLNYAS